MVTEELLQLALRWFHATAAVSLVGLLHAVAWGRPGGGPGVATGSARPEPRLAAWLRGSALAAFGAGLALSLLLYGSGRYPYLDADGGDPSLALVSTSLVGTLAGAAVYELAARAGAPGRSLAPLVVLAAAPAFAASLEHLGASRRALYVHTGAWVASVPIALSWTRLAPALARGQEPGPAARHAARLTLPVVLLMLAVDQPGLTGQDPWPVALGAVLGVGYAGGLLIERALDRQ